MFKFIKTLFSSSSVVDATINGIDSVVFTDQEKSNYFLMLLKAYEPFRLAQRFLALIVGIPFVIVHIVAALLTGFEAGSAGDLVDMNNDTLGQAFSLIIFFYFGGGAVEGVVRTINDKGNNHDANTK